MSNPEEKDYMIILIVPLKAIFCDLIHSGKYKLLFQF